MKHTALSALLIFCSVTARATPPVTSAPEIDLTSYLGTWYEIAAIPQWFQRKCVGNTKAEYARAEDGLIGINNSCDYEDGTRHVASGRAKVVDEKTNSKLKVTFVNIFGWQFLLGGNYWILGVGEKYAYAIVGEPSRKYAWILSRTPSLAAPLMEQAMQRLRDQGYDICELLSTPQAGGLSQRISICSLPTKQ